MRFLLAALGAASVFATMAHAADKPQIGPAPTWVKAVALPPASEKGREAPVRVLLVDQQLAMERGQQTVYSEAWLKIQSPQGLAAGNVSLSWRSETDVLTVHKLLIHRGGQVIDVLKSGQSFTVLRREQNLESATLDGVLTANIQPEGLQVGDVLQVATSVSSRDPTLKGHVEQFVATWDGFPIARAHLRMHWPTSLPARFRQTSSLPALKSGKMGETTIVELTLDNLEPVVPPAGAPPRYRVGRLVEVTDFASWADLGALMAPLYDKAAIISAQGPLRSELERIRSLSSDPKVRAEAALALVQDRVRYVALSMGAGGYVPADAETSWSRRYGDCKGKTALLLALLHAMDIEAEPVAVSTTLGDGLDARLPMAGLFDHVLVRASIAGHIYWLDGTRTGDTRLDRLNTPNFGWGLPLLAKGAALIRIFPAPLSTPTQEVSIRIDASKGTSAPAPTTVETLMRGDDAIGNNAQLTSLSGEARDQALREYWKDQYDFIDVKTVGFDFNQKTGELRLSMTGEAKLDWENGDYQTDGTSVGYRADFSRTPGPDKDAPFAVSYPYFTRTRETIVLPKGGEEFKPGTGTEVDETAGGIEYHRHATIADGVFAIEKTERSVVAEFPASDAPAQQAALRRLYDSPALVHMSASHSYTGNDIAVAKAQVPTTSSGYVRRARFFSKWGMLGDALRDYDKAIELDPGNASAWASRGMVRTQTGDLAGAKSDLAKSESIAPALVENAIGQGMLADAEHRSRDAIAAYTRALKLAPDNDYAIDQRTAAYVRLGDSEGALAILTSAIENKPDSSKAYLHRGIFFLDQEELDKAIADLDKAHALDPSSEWPLANRGMAKAWKDDFVAATSDLDAATRINPDNRVVLRARGLIAQRKGALQEAIAAYTSALQLEPDNSFALGHRAEVEHLAGDDEAALRDSAAALKRAPEWIGLYLLRENILSWSQGRESEGLAEAVAVTAANPDNNYAYVVAASIYNAHQKGAEAIQAYDRALAIKPEAYIYVNRGVQRPKTDLTGRRADFDAALKLDPNMAEAVAGKADVEMDSGDLSGAISTYSTALAKSPNDPSLLSGRGIAYARSGDMARANADFARASAVASRSEDLNSMCWRKATTGVALESALADCNAALARVPDLASYLDSRALVLLRLGRLDEAIADYNRVLAKSPNLSSSLFGRAVAWQRKGDRAKSEADAAAAMKRNPNIQARFESYGIKR